MCTKVGCTTLCCCGAVSFIPNGAEGYDLCSESGGGGRLSKVTAVQVRDDDDDDDDELVTVTTISGVMAIGCRDNY